MIGMRWSAAAALFLVGLMLLPLAAVTQAEPEEPAVTVITVNSSDDPDTSKSRTCLTYTPCTLRRAIVQARLVAPGARPVRIKFNIPKADPGYRSALENTAPVELG